MEVRKQRDRGEQKEGIESGENGISGTAEKHEIGRAKATIQLALKKKTLEHYEKVLSKKKTGRELHAICLKPTKQTLKIHKSLCKAASALVVQMRTEKISLNRFLHSRKVPGFDSPELP